MSKKDGGLDIPDDFWTSVKHKPKKGKNFEYASVKLNSFKDYAGPKKCFFTGKKADCFMLDPEYADWHYTLKATKKQLSELKKLKEDGLQAPVSWSCYADGTVLCHHQLMILGSKKKPEIQLVNMNPKKPLAKTLMTKEAQDILLRTPYLYAPQDPIWLVYQGEPMQYLGTWNQEDFNRAAPNGDGQDLYFKMDVFQWFRGTFNDQFEYFGGHTREFFAFQCRKQDD